MQNVGQADVLILKQDNKKFTKCNEFVTKDNQMQKCGQTLPTPLHAILHCVNSQIISELVQEGNQYLFA